MTTLTSLLKILKDLYLKSSSITGKLNQGYGIYKNNDFVYFSTTNIAPDDRLCKFVADKGIIMYYSSDLLYGKSFYTSTQHSPVPDSITKWKDSTGRIRYKRKYPKNYSYTNKTLNSLYKHSMESSDGKDHFFIFNQVAVKNKIKIDKYLVSIQLVNCNENDISKVIKLLKIHSIGIKNIEKFKMIGNFREEKNITLITIK